MLRWIVIARVAALQHAPAKYTQTDSNRFGTSGKLAVITLLYIHWHALGIAVSTQVLDW